MKQNYEKNTQKHENKSAKKHINMTKNMKKCEKSRNTKITKKQKLTKNLPPLLSPNN